MAKKAHNSLDNIHQGVLEFTSTTSSSCGLFRLILAGEKNPRANSCDWTHNRQTETLPTKRQDARSNMILHLYKAGIPILEFGVLLFGVLVCFLQQIPSFKHTKKCKALERETKASFRVSPQANNREYDGTIINKSKAV